MADLVLGLLAGFVAGVVTVVLVRFDRDRVIERRRRRRWRQLRRQDRRAARARAWLARHPGDGS